MFASATSGPVTDSSVQIATEQLLRKPERHGDVSFICSVKSVKHHYTSKWFGTAEEHFLPVQQKGLSTETQIAGGCTAPPFGHKTFAQNISDSHAAAASSSVVAVKKISLHMESKAKSRVPEETQEARKDSRHNDFQGHRI